MSLDQHVRDGLARAAASFTPDVEAHLALTRRRFRRRQTTRRVALAAVALAVIAVAVPVTLNARDANGDRTVVANAPTNRQARALLQDTWVTRTVTKAQVSDTLTAAGLGQHVDAVTAEQGYPTAWTLRITRNRYEVRSASGVQYDTGTWAVNGDVLTLTPSQCPCELTFGWTLNEGRLGLTLIRDASPDIGGVPDEAYARAQYTTAPFARFRAETPSPTTR